MTSLRVQTSPHAPDLECTPARAKPRAAKPVDTDPPEVPDDEAVQSQVQDFRLNADVPVSLPGVTRPTARFWQPAQPAQALRVGIWGDSHLAAGFFTSELVRLSQLPADQVSSRFLPANMNRAGVRLPLRKSCVSPHWQYEPAHVASAASATGPGLVNLFSQQEGAWLAWDLRNAQAQPDKLSVRWLYQQTSSPMSLAIRVDDGQEQRIDLQGPEGPAVLELVGDAPLSTVHLRLVQGAFRWQGLEWPLPAQTRLQLDVFGYPGATVAGWRQARSDDLAAWWGSAAYDVVVLEFGTNEGNVQPFDASTYTQMLQTSVAAWRSQFPQAACVLVAPGDRGVLVRRSQKLTPAASLQIAHGNAQSSSPAKGGKAPAARRELAGGADLLRFTRVHAQIGRIQQQVAAAHGCRYWSMLEAMGGAGGAYRWVKQTPPLMARDLIHFTVPGYQRLAQSFAQDIGWNPTVFAHSPAPSAAD
ncbi:GDSL-type esterase/lipase family protein [Limnohabitans sp. DM1]|uniref:GDSL-type esterase/lipase family protein n=1 Tax=Limnohabitans sp. DM1 TaxID=1597955 RepID=UPI001892B0DB|nr:GDSL-type esterase/lipase family protein [Limnohabitans sp. DM1]